MTLVNETINAAQGLASFDWTAVHVSSAPQRRLFCPLAFLALSSIRRATGIVFCQRQGAFGRARLIWFWRDRAWYLFVRYRLF